MDSEETSAENGKAANAVDGDPATFWHTQWGDANPAHPHEIIIDLSQTCKIKGFSYLPRQDGQDNGTIKDYEFYVSDDGKEFGQPVKKGTFEGGKGEKTVTFDARPCRFLKLKALSKSTTRPAPQPRRLASLQNKREGQPSPVPARTWQLGARWCSGAGYCQLAISSSFPGSPSGPMEARS